MKLGMLGQSKAKNAVASGDASDAKVVNALLDLAARESVRAFEDEERVRQAITSALPKQPRKTDAVSSLASWFKVSGYLVAGEETSQSRDSGISLARSHLKYVLGRDISLEVLSRDIWVEDINWAYDRWTEVIKAIRSRREASLPALVPLIPKARVVLFGSLAIFSGLVGIFIVFLGGVGGFVFDLITFFPLAWVFWRQTRRSNQVTIESKAAQERARLEMAILDSSCSEARALLAATGNDSLADVAKATCAKFDELVGEQDWYLHFHLQYVTTPFEYRTWPSFVASLAKRQLFQNQEFNQWATSNMAPAVAGLLASDLSFASRMAEELQGRTEKERLETLGSYDAQYSNIFRELATATNETGELLEKMDSRGGGLNLGISQFHEYSSLWEGSPTNARLSPQLCLLNISINTHDLFSLLLQLSALFEKSNLVKAKLLNLTERLNAESKWLSKALVTNHMVPALKQAGGTMANVNSIGFVEAVHAAYKVQLPWKVVVGLKSIDEAPDSTDAGMMGELEFAVWRTALEKLREFVRKWLAGIAPARRQALIDAVSKTTTVGEAEVAKMAVAEHDEVVKKLEQLLVLYDNAESIRHKRLRDREASLQSESDTHAGT